MNRNLGRIGAAALVIVLLVGAYMTWRVVDNTATALDQLGADEASVVGDEAEAEVSAAEAPVARKGRKARRGRKARLAQETDEAEAPPRFGRVPAEMLGGRALEAPVLRRGTAVHEVLRGQPLAPDPDRTAPLVGGEGAVISTELAVPTAPEVDTGTP